MYGYDVFCVALQGAFEISHTMYFTHALKDAFFIQRCNLRVLSFKSS